MSDLPVSWHNVELGEAAELIRGVSYKKEFAREAATPGFIPVLRATNITGMSLTFEDLVFVPTDNVSDQQLLQIGDVVIASSSGSKEIVGKSGSFTQDHFKGSFGAFCTGLRPSKELSLDFFGYYFQTPNYRKNISDLSAGSNINNLKSSDLASQKFPLPPLQEQERIATRLDELFSDLDAGIAELKAAQKKLAQYRQSLLKAAVDGSLTAEWRKNNPPTETGAELLERILKERRTRWEAKQLAKFQEQGKTPPKDWQNKYPNPVEPDTTGLPELPEGWTLATTGLIAESIVPNRDKPLTFTGHIPWITTPDFEQKDLHLKKSISGFGLSENECEMYRARIVPSQSVIMTCVGRFGLSAVLDVRAVINQQLHAFVPESGVRAEYLTFVIQAQRNWLERNATSTTIAYLNKEKCESLPVPLPPVNEQDAVLKLLKPQLASITVKLRNVGFSLKQAAAQRQNILRAAFAGQLVPQDPNDEPASVLLERIRAERATQAKPKTRGRKKVAA